MSDSFIWAALLVALGVTVAWAVFLLSGGVSLLMDIAALVTVLGTGS